MTIRTPCIGVCSTSLGDDVCRGCGRTLEEIRDWASLTHKEREAIMQRLERDHDRSHRSTRS